MKIRKNLTEKGICTASSIRNRQSLNGWNYISCFGSHDNCVANISRCNNKSSTGG